MSRKVKSINGYINEKGHKFVVIRLDNGEVVFINEGLLAYACRTAKPVKAKAE